MTRDQVTATAATVMSVITAAITLFVTPYLEDTNLLIKVLATIICAIGFYTVFKFVHRLLSKWRFRKILGGEWYYRSETFDGVPFKDGNIAIMRFKLNRDEDIEYDVDIYDRFYGSHERRKAAPRGHARSLAAHYDVANKEVNIVFFLTYIGRDSRKGRLSLRLLDDDRMVGEWASHIAERKPEGDGHQMELSAGRLFAAREPVFKQWLEKHP